MPRVLPDLLNPEAAGVAALGALAIAGVVIVVRHYKRKKPSPEEVEAQRRQWLSQFGKLAGGEIVEVSENAIAYLYDIRGINYTTSQDVTALQARLPVDRWSIVGGVGVRYDPRNPANSIVLSETWTGLRQRDHKAS